MNSLNWVRRVVCSCLIPRPLVTVPKVGFSEYFRTKDLQDFWQYNNRKIVNKRYRALLTSWRIPLARKRLRQIRVKQIKANLPVPQIEPEKLVVHNPALGIKTPSKEAIFAVIRVDRRQFKVTHECMILLDTKPEHELNKKMTFEVLLIGTDTYTALGRPLVKTATVDGVIESISMTEKIIVFKKKRRKQYKKSFGSRVPITSCRITKVVHNLTPELLAKAVPLS